MTATSKSHRGSPRQRRATPRRRRLGVLPVIAALIALMLTPLAHAATPVYEMTGRWVTDTPDTVRSGDVLNAEWRVNVNDADNPPANEPVDDVHFELALANGRFSTLPDSCLTEGVEPVSAVSEDGSTLVCNIGTQDQGTAHMVSTPIIADGPSGSQLSATGTIEGDSAALPPIEITNAFLMDIAWGGSTSGVARGGTHVDVDLEWTLFLGQDSDPGPDSVTYTLDITTGSGAAVETGPNACTPFTVGANGSVNGASGHPWSGGDHPGEQMAPFVASCTLAQTGPNTFQLTLSGIDYSREQVPTHDSTGELLPTDRDAVASGSVWLRVAGVGNDSITLRSDAPQYTAPGSGDVSVDDASNNTSNKAWTMGGWSNAYRPEQFGVQIPSWWSNQYYVSPGTMVDATTVHQYGQQDYDRTATMGQCVILDTKYVTYDHHELWWNWSGQRLDGANVEYYVGSAPVVDPDSPLYDPNAFACADDPAGWTTEAPVTDEDREEVRAVKVTYPFALVHGAANVPLVVRSVVDADAPVGMDVWEFGELLDPNGQWSRPNRSTAPNAGTGPRTPDARYPFIGSGRDVLYVVDATPAITKEAERPVVRPGVPVGYTLTYSANGTGAVPPTVDGYEIVDVLPAGMTYVPGSASPEPVVTTDSQGRAVLTWTLDAVPTNTEHTLRYEAVADDSVTPGGVLTNTVAATYGPVTHEADAQVSVATNGFTSISKTADSPFIPNVDGDGVGEGSWTVTVRSFDPAPQAYTDVIDVLPYEGDGRGTAFTGSYTLTGVEAEPDATVYYTTADPATLSDDPDDPSNGAAGDPAGNTVGWTTDFTPDATAVRVVGPELSPGASQAFTVAVATDGAQGGDTLVNRAQGRAGHTELVMRTSAPVTVANHYSAALKKYVQDAEGQWRDANEVENYPEFRIGDEVTYRIVVENTGQGPLTNIEISDDRQPELGSFVIESLAPGESDSHEYTVTIEESDGDGVVNTACADADVPADSGIAPEINCDPAGVDVVNYTVVKGSDPASGSTVTPGQVVTYTVTVAQEGTVPAEAWFSDSLAGVLDDATYNGDVRADIGEATVEDGVLSWQGTLPVGEVATVTYSVTVNEAVELGDATLANVVTSPGCVGECGTEHPGGWYTFAKSSDPASGSTVLVGETVAYTVTITQHGPGVIDGARVVDDLTEVLDDATYNGDAAATSGDVEVEQPELRWTGDLGVGDTVTITYSVTVNEVEQLGDRELANVVTTDDERGWCEDGDCRTEHEVPREPLFELPITGGIGRTAFPILGGLIVALVIAAGAAHSVRTRRI